MNKNKTETQLARNLSLFEATIFGISYVIGTGVFLKPSSVLNSTGSTGMSLIIWALAGFVTICAALTIAEIAAYIPELGGMYTYLSELFGELVGFLYGWVYVLVVGPGGIAASAIAFSTFASYFLEMTPGQMRMLSFGVVILFGILQALSTKGVMKIQVLGTIGKLAPIAAILLFGIFKGNIPGAINLSMIGSPDKVNIGVALIGALWAYDGWIATCTLGGEMVNSEKNLPKAIVASIIFVMAVYIAFNWVIFKTLPANEILATENVGVRAAEVLFGGTGGLLISVGVLISSVVTMNAQMMSNERYILPMAERKLLPASDTFAYIHPKFNTPIPCIIVTVLFSLFFIGTGTFETVSNMVIFILWVFFTVLVAGIFKLRKTRERDNSLYHVPLFPIIPILGITGGLYLVFSTVTTDFRLSLYGLAAAAVGIPVFLYFNKKKEREENQ
ncbi:amino acid permease [Peptoniphilus sp. KCTC 25270]|uniref:APC family permease n=1 Tax=Peptoniphilus sp. KCTC 25270 TaxID=2897414 RepID=UPI001E4DB939|nr:amino acid permease [Peptoniphilus sp. KCTC 25270]MCD1147502.1 amino acid permease [Peptoniphilus sp. KCTC 25270]